ncbi:MAG: extracellular solute-binding protein [Desertifilum sp.]|nr:extracellular solute-binding protein [Desertifilum sp.]
MTSLNTLRWLALSTLPTTLSACGTNPDNTLNVRLLKNSIPPQLVRQFRAGLDRQISLNFAAEEQLSHLFELLTPAETPAATQQQLLPWRRTPGVSQLDLVTLGNYWLSAAIQQQRIQPLNAGQLQTWSELPSRWQQLVRRNDQGQPDANGAVWGIPYRWGTTVLAFRRDRFRDLGWTPTDWSDLWRPELAGKISLLDQAREIIGLTLKKLGQSYNTANLDDVANLRSQLQQLHRQARFYSSTHYLQPLITGDTQLAVGWSSDVLAAMERYPQINAVIPLSGTALWAELWVRPANASNENPLVNQWIDFCLAPERAGQLSLLTGGDCLNSIRLQPRLAQGIAGTPSFVSSQPARSAQRVFAALVGGVGAAIPAILGGNAIATRDLGGRQQGRLTRPSQPILGGLQANIAGAIGDVKIAGIGR